MKEWEELFPWWKELTRDEQLLLKEKSIPVTYKREQYYIGVTRIALELC